jgi:hypothetical protein
MSFAAWLEADVDEKLANNAAVLTPFAASHKVQEHVGV